jgi:Tfp pilus assembly protein FimV
MRYLVLTIFCFTHLAWADSKRIEVYPLSQSYWDVKRGDTLGEIVDTLIPQNPYLQQKLMRDILSLNPAVFPEGNPHRMLADRRLWLPNTVKQPQDTAKSSDTLIETYQWGSIKRRDK